MNYRTLRIWFIVSITPALAAVVVRFIWELTINSVVGTWIIMILLILAFLGIYALLLYLIIKPGLKKLKKLPVRIGITAIITAATISCIIHFVRFVPSPEAASLPSVIIASLLLMGCISTCLLVLWVIWKSRIV